MSRSSIEQLYMLIKLVPGVSGVQHRESFDFLTGSAKVEFRVTSVYTEAISTRAMEAQICTDLEAVRPAGVQFVVGVVPAGSDVERRFPPPPPTATSTSAERPKQIVSRSRFAAVVEEMTESPSDELSVPIRDLSRELIYLNPAGRLTCRRCTCEAFEPIAKVGEPLVVVCMGCPDTPTYLIDGIPDGLNVLETRRYTCWGCKTTVDVTMTLSEVNLHCRRCKRLSLHERVSDRPTRLMFMNGRDDEEAEFEPLEDDGENVGRAIDTMQRRIASVFGMSAEQLGVDTRMGVTVTDTFFVPQDKYVGERLTQKALAEAALALADADAISKVDPREAKMLTRPGDYLRAFGYPEKRVEDLPREAFRAGYDVADVSLGEFSKLVETMRVVLNLEPFFEFARRERDLNVTQRGLSVRDWDRRTGRTMFGVVEALAMCSVRDADALHVRGRNFATEMMICALAREITKRIITGRMAQLTIKSAQRVVDPGKMVEYPKAVLYVDHSCVDT